MPAPRRARLRQIRSDGVPATQRPPLISKGAMDGVGWARGDMNKADAAGRQRQGPRAQLNSLNHFHLRALAGVAGTCGSEDSQMSIATPHRIPPSSHHPLQLASAGWRGWRWQSCCCWWQSPASGVGGAQGGGRRSQVHTGAAWSSRNQAQTHASPHTRYTRACTHASRGAACARRRPPPGMCTPG